MKLIFEGQDRNKQKQQAVPKQRELTGKRTRNRHITQTHNRWSTQESMKDYIRRIIKPWVDAKGGQHGILLPHCCTSGHQPASITHHCTGQLLFVLAVYGRCLRQYRMLQWSC